MTRVSFRKVPIGGTPVEFPDDASSWRELRVDFDRGIVLVGFEHHDEPDTDERGVA